MCHAWAARRNPTAGLKLQYIRHREHKTLGEARGQRSQQLREITKAWQGPHSTPWDAVAALTLLAAGHTQTQKRATEQALPCTLQACSPSNSFRPVLFWVATTITQPPAKPFPAARPLCRHKGTLQREASPPAVCTDKHGHVEGTPLCKWTTPAWIGHTCSLSPPLKHHTAQPVSITNCKQSTN